MLFLENSCTIGQETAVTGLEKILFESGINRASRDYPYISHESVDLNYMAHFHDELEVVLVTTGSLWVTVQGSRLRLLQGDICLFMPGEIHSMETREANQEVILKAALPESVADRLRGLRLQENIIGPAHPLHEELGSLLQELLREDREKPEGYQVNVQICVLRLFLMILRRLPTWRMERDEAKKVRRRLEFLHAVNNYLSSSFRDVVTLESTARACGYSKYYFSHYFKSVTEMSFSQYLMIYRLRQARERILAGDKMIDAAYSCGFNNIRSFNRMFKKYYHITPTEYRLSGQGGSHDEIYL